MTSSQPYSGAAVRLVPSELRLPHASTRSTRRCGSTAMLIARFSAVKSRLWGQALVTITRFWRSSEPLRCSATFCASWRLMMRNSSVSWPRSAQSTRPSSCSRTGSKQTSRRFCGSANPASAMEICRWGAPGPARCRSNGRRGGARGERRHRRRSPSHAFAQPGCRALDQGMLPIIHLSHHQTDAAGADDQSSIDDEETHECEGEAADAQNVAPAWPPVDQRDCAKHRHANATQTRQAAE